MWAAEFLAFARTITPAARLRLAPTPSGYLHLGNALNFTLNWLAARVHPGAQLLLRIDDLWLAAQLPSNVLLSELDARPVPRNEDRPPAGLDDLPGRQVVVVLAQVHALDAE